MECPGPGKPAGKSWMAPGTKEKNHQTKQLKTTAQPHHCQAFLVHHIPILEMETSTFSGMEFIPWRFFPVTQTELGSHRTCYPLDLRMGH